MIESRWARLLVGLVAVVVILSRSAVQAENLFGVACTFGALFGIVRAGSRTIAAQTRTLAGRLEELARVSALNAGLRRREEDEQALVLVQNPGLEVVVDSAVTELL